MTPALAPGQTLAHGGAVGAALELSVPLVIVLALLAPPLLRRLRGSATRVRETPDEPIGTQHR